MFYCNLKKIESSHANLRGGGATGLAPELPQVGKSFFMYGDPITPGTVGRYIHTTEVQSVRRNDDNGDIVFQTQNSVYVLTNIVKAGGDMEDAQIIEQPMKRVQEEDMN